MSRLYALIVILLFSCTIINDDDILTQEDFDKNLVVESIEINENTSAEELGSINASYDYSSTGNLSNIFWGLMSVDIDEEDPAGPGERQLGKLRFNLFFDVNSGGYPPYIDGTTNFVYDGSGRIVSISNRFDNGGIGTVLFQQFNYTYNASGKLIRIETLNNQHDIFRKTRTVDDLNYTEDRITSVERTLESTTATTFQIITIKYSGIGVVSEIKKGNTTNLNNCAPNLDHFYCYFSQTTGGGFSNSSIIYGEGAKPSQLTITEQRFEDNGSTGAFGDQTGRPPDHFFVSPYIFTPQLFENGRELAQIFIDDWWIKGTGTSSMFQVTKNETITINFTYSLLQ